MNMVMPREPDWKRAVGGQPTRPTSLDTAAAAVMRPSENPHAARRSKPSRKETTVYGKYIGRVGALAVALGIGGAIATTPGVAWADDTSSESNSSATSSESNSSESNSSESNSSESNSSESNSSESNSSESNLSESNLSESNSSESSSAASTDESNSSADQSDTSESSETTTTRESGATVRRSRGQHTSGTTGAKLSTDDDTPAGTRSTQVRSPAATDSLTASTKAGATALRPRSSGGISVSTDGQAADQPNQSPTTTFTSKSSTSNAPQLIETAIKPADPPVSKPASLVAAALGSLLAPGPQDPPESPALLAELAWARRQSIRELADQTTVPSSMQTAQMQRQTAAGGSQADGEVSPLAGVNAPAEVSAQPHADTQVIAVVAAAEAAAAPLPAPWDGDDIGRPTQAGSSSYANGVFTVNGSGYDIWGSRDQFHFVHQTLTGDGQIIARVTAEENTDPWAKAGVMIKQSATARAPYALLAVTPANGITFQSGFNQKTQAPAIAPPNAWLKLTRTGNTITGYTSTNGQTWTQVGWTTVALDSTAEIGLFVTARTQGRWWRPAATRVNTSTFDNVSVTAGVTPPPTTLPSWAGDDIGGPTQAGSSSYANGVFTVNGSGIDIWGGHDQFHFVHQTLTGDGQIIARVTAQENTDPWAKTGVMIKQSATAGAPYVLLAVTPANGIALQSGFNHNIQVPRIAPPNAWLKLTRTGNTITGYTSTNGQTWTQVGSTTVALDSTAEIGLFVTARNGTQSRWWRPQTRVNTSTFDNVSVTAGVIPPSIFFEASPSIGEADGTVMVPIVRTGDLTRPSTIEYGITPDTATAEVDYRGEHGTITMDVGEDRAFIPVKILNDNLSESTETFVVSIINVDSGSKILFPRTARVDILDDENPVVDPTSPPLTSNYTVTQQVVASGLNQALAFELAPHDPSLMYVAEKGGVIKVFNVGTGTQQSTFIDISSKVNDIQDRGLLDIALHPNFGQPVQPGQPEHNYVYAFYVVDPPDTAGKAGNAKPDGAGNRFAYLVRLTADAATNYTTAVPGSEVILLGGAAQTLQDISGAGVVDSTSNISQPESGFHAETGEYVDDYVKVDSRSHAGGSLAFGPDGALYVSIGDGASFDTTDPRAVSVQNINSLSGKILRIDPLTGLGLPDNPFVAPRDDLSANRSKVYQLGLRNPFSIGFAQDGRLFISNTGWFSWEEIESGPPGANFGWPYFEGGDNGVILPAPGYQNLPSDAARNLPSAAEFYAAVASGSITITPAFRAFAHAQNAPGYQLGAIVGVGAPYSGSRYPAEFQNDIFFTDINEDAVFVVDVNNRSNVKFLYRARSASPIAFSQGPDGYMYVANMGTGKIARLLIVPIQL